MARILGLDIGTTAVRGALVRTATKRSEVLRYIEVPLDAGGVPAPDRATAVRDAIRAIIVQLPRAAEGVVVAVPGEDASLRVVELPAAAAKRIADVLPFELESLIPFAIEDAVIDYQPIDQVDGKLRLLVAAVPRDKIGAMLTELRESAIDPREVAVGAAALDGLVSLLPQLAGPGPFVLVDIGQNHTDVCVLRNGRTELARTLSSGVSTLEASRTGSEVLGRAIQQTVTSYRAAGGPAPELCCVSGRGGIAEGCVPWIAETLHVPAEILPLPAAPGSEAAPPALFARAAALAARTAAARAKRIDVRQGEFAAKRTMGSLRQQAPLLIGCAVAIFVSFVFATYARWATADDRREMLLEELARVSRETLGEETRDPQHARELLEGSGRPGDPLPRFDAFDVLDAISARVPAEVVHDTRRLTIELEDDMRTGRFELQGSVSTIGDRDRIATELEQHECFHEIEKGRTSPAVGQDRLNYQVEADVDCTPEEQRQTKNRPAGTGGRRGSE